MDFVPNVQCEDLERIIAKEGEERINFLYERSVYATDRALIHDVPNEKTSKFKYPCVFKISRNVNLRDENGGKLTLHYSSKIEKDKSGNPIFFGTPKVIISVWQQSGIPYVDHDGRYGMCQEAAGIVDDPANLSTIAKVMDGSRFRNAMKAAMFNTREWNRHVVKLLRKNFWKDFVDDSGNLIDEHGNAIDRLGNLMDEHGNIIRSDEKRNHRCRLNVQKQ